MLVGIYDNNHVYYSSNKSHSKAPKTIVAPCVVIYSQVFIFTVLRFSFFIPLFSHPSSTSSDIGTHENLPLPPYMLNISRMREMASASSGISIDAHAFGYFSGMSYSLSSISILCFFFTRLVGHPKNHMDRMLLQGKVLRNEKQVLYTSLKHTLTQ